MGAPEDLKTVACVFLAIDSIFVCLRLFVRIHLKKGSFGYDDVVLGVGFAGYVVLCSMTFLCIGYGFGVDDPQPGYDLTKATMYFMACQLTYIIAACIVKLALALVLYRLAVATMKLIRRVLLCSMVTVVVFSLATFLTVALQCRPLSLAWGVGEGSCIDGKFIVNIGYAFSAMDIATSFLYALLPVAMLWKVQLSWRIKASVMLIFGLGVFSSIATLIRLEYIVQLSTLSSSDPTGASTYLRSLVWTHLELALAIFAASLAALRPLLQFVVGNGSTAGSGNRLKGNQDTAGHEMGPVLRLDDKKKAESNSSQEFILDRGRLRKDLDVEESYSMTSADARGGRALEPRVEGRGRG